MISDEEFADWCGLRNVQRCIIIELDYVIEVESAPVVGTLYFSDAVYFDTPSSSPPPAVYIDRIDSVPEFERSLSGDRLAEYSASYGTIVFNNPDGDLDFMLGLAIDGSEARHYLGDVTWPRSDFRHIFTALSSQASAPSIDKMQIALKDTGLLLNKSIGGTVLVGGSGPNAAQYRSANFGYVHNLTPLLVDAAIPRYTHNDTGLDTALPAVRDRGDPVLFTDNGDGTFDPTAGVQGLITCDVVVATGSSSSPPLDNRSVSDAMAALVGERAGLAALGKYGGPGPTFNVHDDDDYLVGISLPEARNVIDLLRDLTDSGNCFWSVLRTGEFTFGRLRPDDIEGLVADSGSPPSIGITTIVEDDIDEGSFNLSHSQPLYYQYQAYMSRNWTPQTDLAAILDPDQQDVWRRKGIYDLQELGIGTAYADHPELYNKSLTVSPVIDTLLSGGFDELDLPFLQQWMNTRRDTLLPWIEIASLTVGIDFYALEMGGVVDLVLPRFGEDAGTLFQVIAVKLRLTQAKVDLRIVRRRLLGAPPDDWLRLTQVIDDPPFPTHIGESVIPPDVAIPRIFPTPGSPIAFGGDSAVSIVYGGLRASGRFFRPPVPDPDGYIVLMPTHITTPSEGGDPFADGFYVKGAPDPTLVYASLSFQSSIPTINGVAGQLAIIDTDGKFEISGATNGSGNFAAAAIGIPAYSWELTSTQNFTSTSFIPVGGNRYVATDNFGGSAGTANVIYAIAFWANRQQYIAYLIKTAAAGSGDPVYVGVTTASDLRASYGGVTTPPILARGTPGVASTVYRDPISSTPKNEQVLVSGPDITSPFSGMAVTAQQGAQTTTQTEIAPANDNFASSVRLSAGPVTNQAMPVVSNQFATTEGSEPCSTGTATKTVWYDFVPAANGNISLKTLGSYRSDDSSFSNPLDTVLTVYTGSAVGSLTQIQANNDGGTDVTSAIASFAVTANTHYRIQISVNSGATGQYGGVILTYTCNFAMLAPPVITTTPNPGNLIFQSHTTPLSIAPAASNSPSSWAITWLTNVGGASSQPSGISFNTSTGAVSGTATAGNSPGQIVQITATNGAGTSAPYQVPVFLT